LTYTAATHEGHFEEQRRKKRRKKARVLRQIMDFDTGARLARPGITRAGRGKRCKRDISNPTGARPTSSLPGLLDPVLSSSPLGKTVDATLNPQR
jgi:hypothetical protein